VLGDQAEVLVELRLPDGGVEIRVRDAPDQVEVAADEALVDEPVEAERVVLGDRTPLVLGDVVQGRAGPEDVDRVAAAPAGELLRVDEAVRAAAGEGTEPRRQAKAGEPRSLEGVRPAHSTPACSARTRTAAGGRPAAGRSGGGRGADGRTASRGRDTRARCAGTRGSAGTGEAPGPRRRRSSAADRGRAAPGRGGRPARPRSASAAR